MNLIKRIIIMGLFVYPFGQMGAQINLSDLNISKVFDNITSKTKYGIFKSQKIKGKISGMGVFQFRNGDLYYGDLFDKDFNGRGTLISAQNNISNCPNCTAFVGKFKNGLKVGKGRCYNNKGELIYIGKFIDDKPIDTYPTTDFENVELSYFTEFKGNDYCFVGEFIGDTPNGAGLFIYSSGDVYITNLKDGSLDGIGVYIQSDGEWFSEKNTLGNSTIVSSSQEYSMLKQKAKENFRQGLSIAFGYFSEALQTGAELTNQIQTISDASRTTSVSVADDTNGNLRSSESNTKSGKYNISEQQSYNRDKSTYSKYDGLLSKAFAGNSSATITEIKEWQKKMRQLREKWEAKGKDFPHFPNEDK